MTLLAGGSTSCLLDTGPINMPPTVQINQPNQALHPGEPPVTFTATIHDPDQSTDSLDVAWYVGEGGDCDKAVASAPVCRPTQNKDQCSYEPRAFGSICVVVGVTDRYGAKAEAKRTFTVQDRAPVAGIERTSPASTPGMLATAPLPLFSNLTFSAAPPNSSDPDPGDEATLSYSWTVIQPDGTELSECPTVETSGTCSFTATMTGTYHVEVTATDTSGMDSAPASVDVVIARDQPPCIVGFKPETLQTYASADQSTTFAVNLVTDDADPYPGSSLGTFTWWYRMGKSSAFARLSNTYQYPYQSNQLDFGQDVFVTGDEIQVRVEYQDRVSRDFSSCDQNADRCELVPGSGCYQWVTWTVDFI